MALLPCSLINLYKHATIQQISYSTNLIFTNFLMDHSTVKHVIVVSGQKFSDSRAPLILQPMKSQEPKLGDSTSESGQYTHGNTRAKDALLNVKI
jgi:hypothetical protein